MIISVILRFEQVTNYKTKTVTACALLKLILLKILVVLLHGLLREIQYMVMEKFQLCRALLELYDAQKKINPRIPIRFMVM